MSNMPDRFRERMSAQGSMLELSMTGCRARGAFVFKEGNVLGLLIDVPRYQIPLQVALAVVRQSDGQEFGMEFIEMEPDDQRGRG
jgi:hypothetical protein